ncbi:MAG: hypothetical protein ACPG7F_11695 [Aggregatilineales bacterium]
MNTGFQLWHLLRYPPTQQHLFKDSVRRSSGRLFRLKMERWSQIVALVLLAVTFLLSRTLFVILIAVVPVALMLSFILMSGSFYGLWRAIQTVTHLTKLRRNGQHEALYLSPAGQIGVLYLVSAGVLHRADLLREIHRLLRMVIRIVLVTIGLITLILGIGIITSPAPVYGETGAVIILAGVMPLATIAAIIYLDFVYSIVTAALLAKLIAQFTEHRFEAQFWTGITFISLQITQYLLFALLLLLSLFAAQTLTPMQSPTRILLAGLTVIIFYSIREAFTGLLWRFLLYMTGTPWREWQNFLQWWTG